MGSKRIFTHWLTVLLQNSEFDIPSGLALEAKEHSPSNFYADFSAKMPRLIPCRRQLLFAREFINGTIFPASSLMQCT